MQIYIIFGISFFKVINLFLIAILSIYYLCLVAIATNDACWIACYIAIVRNVFYYDTPRSNIYIIADSDIPYYCHIYAYVDIITDNRQCIRVFLP